MKDGVISCYLHKQSGVCPWCLQADAEPLDSYSNPPALRPHQGVTQCDLLKAYQRNPLTKIIIKEITVSRGYCLKKINTEWP